MPTNEQDIDSNPPDSDYDNEKLDLRYFDDMDDNNLLPGQPPFQEVPFPPNAAPTSTRAAKRTCSSPNDEHPSARKSARTRSNSMESLSDLNKEVHQSNSNMVPFPDLELVPSEVSLDPELGDAVETAELSLDPELGDAADELAEDPPNDIGELLSGSSQLENVSFPYLHDAVRTSPENGTSQARILAYEAPFYYTLRCELRKALISVEVEPSHGGGLILSDGVLEDSMLWIAGSGAAPQISMQQEEHRILSEKKS
mmetsp:Transcript_9318/g.16303  ORF Transcript_9318/g.16303 Transcript_9318/m.16303 type:complete len:256 (-) Transcript_9318:1187-1954(-)